MKCSTLSALCKSKQKLLEINDPLASSSPSDRQAALSSANYLLQEQLRFHNGQDII